MAHISTLGAGVFSDFSIARPATDFTATTLATLTTQANWQALFGDTINIQTDVTGVNTFVQLPAVREFPSMGIPANIVNVAQYGSRNSKQVNGQPDSPTIEITVNYTSQDWDTSKRLGEILGNGKSYAFRFSLLNQQPVNFSQGTTALNTTATTTSTAATLSAANASIEPGQAVALTLTPFTKLGRVFSISTTALVLDTAVSIPLNASLTFTGIGEVPNSQWFFYGKVEALLINPQLTDANTATLTVSVQSDFYGPYTSV